MGDFPNPFATMLLSVHKVPIGFITWWAGHVVAVPSGWRLCDGNNGTPDLLDKFVVGAAGTYIVGAEGGAVDHTHYFGYDLHNHYVVVGDDIVYGSGYRESLSQRDGVGLADSANNLPPYYALAYVMYIGPES